MTSYKGYYEPKMAINTVVKSFCVFLMLRQITQASDMHHIPHLLPTKVLG